MHFNEGNEEESKIIEKLRISMYFLFLLSFFRLFCSQFYGLITDLIAALIVYCTYTGKGRIMSLFCLINAVLGVIYSISIGSMDISRLNNNNKINQNKSGNTDFSNNNLNNNNINDNNKYDSKGNYNPNYGNNNNNYFDTGSQENFNALYNSGQNNNNNFGSFNNYNNQDSANFTVIYITAVMIFAVLVYCSITFFSYKAYKIFKNPFGDIFESEENMGSNNNNNYNNQFGGGNYYGATENSNQPRQNTANFVPFNGGGQRLED